MTPTTGFFAAIAPLLLIRPAGAMLWRKYFPTAFASLLPKGRLWRAGEHCENPPGVPPAQSNAFSRRMCARALPINATPTARPDTDGSGAPGGAGRGSAPRSRRHRLLRFGRGIPPPNSSGREGGNGGGGASRPPPAACPKHDPEKWNPVFRKDHA